MDKVKRVSWKEMWHDVFFQSKNCAAVKYILFFGMIATAAVPYINSFVYAHILDSLLVSDYNTAAGLVFLLVPTVMTVELISKACNRMYVHYIRPSECEINKRTAEKAFSMEYEEIEKKETLQSFRRVRMAELSHGGIANYLHMIYQYFTELVKVIFACGFTAVLLTRSDFQKESLFRFTLSTAVLLLVFTGVLVLGRYVARRLGQLELELNLGYEESNTLAGYIRNLIQSEKWGQDIRMYKLQDYLFGKYLASQQSIEAAKRLGKTSGRLNGIVAFALQLLAGTAYVYIVLKAVAGSITTGQVLMYAGAIVTMMNSIRSLMTFHTMIDYSKEYLKTYEEFIDRPNMHYDGTLPIEKRIDHNYRLEMRNVSFRYPGTETDILHHISLTFETSKKLALVGRNGAGKTTLIKLLLRLYEPTEGQILLNGIDIGKYDYNEYVQIFSAVFQDFRLYDLPLDENIAGSETVDEKRVSTVLEQTGLKERVEKMKNGAHTLLYHETGDGEALSGGEAQKVAIARALYKDAPFVILDEPTSALDPVAEAEIYENFNEMIGEKTAIYISHRMSSCKFCDQIVVLDEGKIAEIGTHQSLLQTQGIYYELYQAQAKHYV